MKKLITKPHFLFFGLAFIFVLLGFYQKNINLDISIFEIYFVLQVAFWCYISAVFFCLIGLNYLCLIWAEKKPKIWLTILHLLLQIVSLIPFLYLIFSSKSEEKIPSNGSFYFMDLDQAIVISFVIFLFSIFIHLISFFTSLFLKSK
jgi:hypothetical protein